MEQLLDWNAMAPDSQEDDMMSISVIGKVEAQQDEMLSRIETCTQGKTISCHAGNAELVEDAHHAGLSFGKYQVFLELPTLDPSITVAEVQDMTMRQLPAALAALTEDNVGQTEEAGQGAGGWGHHGGHGAGHS